MKSQFSLGEIGEIAIFTKPLRNEDRKAVEDYIGKKWSRKINRDSTPSCTNGAVTDGGCDLSLARCTLVATGLTSRSVAPATSPTAVNCDTTHYNTSVQLNYTCINGTPSITSGTCTCATGYTGTGCNTCDSANNYVSDGMGGCVSAIPCALSTADVGISTPASVSHAAAGNAYCNANGYDSSLFRGYTCDNGNPNLTGSACVCNAAAGYTGGAGCPSCISPNYYRSGSVCLQKCSINSTVGIVAGTLVNQGSSQTLTCNDSANNFNTSDSLTYTCAAGNSFSVVSGACDTCASGYAYVSGACVPPFTCTGGTKTCSNAPTGTLANNCAGGNVVHRFTSSSSLTCTAGSTSSLAVLIVGGGGGGKRAGGDPGGGGGGGQVVSLSSKYISNGDVISVTVGAGGVVQTTTGSVGNRGQDSVVSFSTTSSTTAAAGNRLDASTTAGGGGGGGSFMNSPNNGTAPSGGVGSGSPNGSTFGVSGTGTQRGGTTGQGNKAGGGGSTANVGGSDGGGAAGVFSTITNATGAYYGGGGGSGAPWSSTTRAGNPGGNGGGGSGGGTGASSGAPAVAGSPNTGGGGGNSICANCDTSFPYNPAGGGSGVVIFAYPGS